MGLKDRLSGIVGGNDPDPQQEMDMLDGSSGDPPEPNEGLAELSGTELAWRLTEMRHQERKDILEDDSFVLHHWEETRDAIDESTDLQEEYGLNGVQRSVSDGMAVCLNHEQPGLIKKDPYKPKQQSTLGRTHESKNNRKSNISTEINAGNVPGMPLSGTGKATGGTGKDNTRKASARHTEVTGPQTMDVCKVDPHDCPTSLKAFYEVAEDQHNAVRDKYIQGKDSSTKQQRTNEYFNEASSVRLSDESRSANADSTQPSTDTRTTEAAERNASTDTAAPTQTARQGWEHGTGKRTKSAGTDETAEEDLNNRL